MEVAINELLSGESQYVEYKRERSQNAKSYVKSIVAFANARGGTILFGVDGETNEIVGVPDDTLFEDMDAISNAVMDSIEPSVTPNIYIEKVEGKSLIVVEVPFGQKCPYFIKSEGLARGVYVRVGATTRPADLEWSRELVLENAPGGYDRTIRRGYETTEEAIEALCDKMFNVALSRCKSEEERESVRRVSVSQLLLWGVLKEREGEILPTVAFSLLSGDGEVHAWVQCGIFRGETRSVFIDRREFEGSVIDLVEQTYQYVLAKINMGADLDGLVRRDVYELPMWPVRELITNAILHRSYLEPGATQVALYDDRLEISSPGGIVRGFTMEKMLSGGSKPRNEALAQAFRYVKLVEGWGSGVPRAVKEIEEYGLRTPEFKDIDGLIRVNIFRRRTRDAFAHSGAKTTNTDKTPINTDKTPINTDKTPINDEKVLCAATRREREILGFVERSEMVSNADVAMFLGLGPDRVKEILRSMTQRGLLVRLGEKKGTRYRLP